MIARIRVLLTTILFAASQALAGGGVDVGNGFRLESLDAQPWATEELLVEDVQRMIPEIESGQNPDVQKKATKFKCRLDKAQFNRLEPEKVYKLDKNLKFTVEEYKGQLYYELDQCLIK
ncbi:MAG: hypothetical protein H6624_14955 [Bdellovibrionaceae bacterium]|nr:hypothetical protein [Bdellovibrionales bacterium]MCB9085643.1 hypothetical protein [Pseudobdellovibrionaceae bacterium]